MGNLQQSWAEWLADPARTGSSSPEVIAEAVERATGATPISIARVLHGEINEVYDVTNGDGERVVVRIGRRSPSLFAGERWALDAARSAGALVPRVLLVDEIDTADERLALCVQEHVGGLPLQHRALAAGSAEEFKQVVRDAGRNLALVHEVRSDGFGWPVDATGNAPDDSWSEFLTMPAREPHWYRPLAIDAGYAGDRFDRALAVLEAHADVYDARPRLVHGDFGAKHVLADERLRALIDFEVCLGGDPAYDVAAWDIYFHNTLRTDWLLDGYREISPLDDTFDLRVRLSLMLLAIRLLGHSRGGFTGFVPLAIKTLDRGLDALG
jgi:fructosamine-3-kinase